MSILERLLIRRLRDRDERAFRDLVSRYGERVYGITFRMMGNAEDAEDVAQEVFITVFKSIDSFRGDSKFSTWLYRITVNQCKNRIRYLARRHQKAKREFDESVARGGAESTMTSARSPRSPDTHLEERQLGVALHEAIASLDEDQRMLVVLRDIEELSYEEISTISELPVGTVKSRIHRARLALRKKLSKY